MTNSLITGLLINELKKERITSISEISNCSFITMVYEDMFRITLNTDGFSENEIMGSLSELRQNTKWHKLKNGGERLTGEISEPNFAPSISKVQFLMYAPELIEVLKKV